MSKGDSISGPGQIFQTAKRILLLVLERNGPAAQPTGHGGDEGAAFAVLPDRGRAAYGPGSTRGPAGVWKHKREHKWWGAHGPLHWWVCENARGRGVCPYPSTRRPHPGGPDATLRVLRLSGRLGDLHPVQGKLVPHLRPAAAPGPKQCPSPTCALARCWWQRRQRHSGACRSHKPKPPNQAPKNL